ncbi:unnamed protein product [Adineta steineri]|uniref:Uncharacterized protein n=1 Tax=Adineta steineri TaxID=433720 RepID=A0A814KEP7_9BILA|nr:unnamed protein product [Adineta steineri]CAF3989815.1 unnamed protein product [Adineta steineri]
MSDKTIQSSKKSSDSDSSDGKKLNCGGKACLTCGACRDWYFDRDNCGTSKHKNSKCIHEHIFDHTIIHDPKDEKSPFPIGRLICECKDNH